MRPAQPRELDRLAALFSLLIEHHAGMGARFTPRAGAEDALRALLEQRLASAGVFVFEQAGQLTGLCVASVALRPALFVETRRGEIEHLVVRPEARRRGTGRALAEHALCWLRAQGVERVEIQVARANPGARAFWEAQGFAASMDVLERGL